MKILCFDCCVEHEVVQVKKYKNKRYFCPLRGGNSAFLETKETKETLKEIKSVHNQAIDEIRGRIDDV